MKPIKFKKFDNDQMIFSLVLAAVILGIIVLRYF